MSNDTLAVRVFLVDDHVILRQAVRALLEREANLQVVGDDADGRSGVKRPRRWRPTS